MRADFAVLLDACVLAESAVADVFLRLSEEPRLLLPRWTGRIWDETDRTCLDALGWPLDLVQKRRSTLTSFFDEAMVSGYERMEAFCTNDTKDRHVLAAAIHAKVETIVTTNLRHFPPESMAPWGILAVHPGTYLVTLYEHDPGIVVDKLRRIADDRGRSLEEMLGRLAWTTPQFSIHVADALSIIVPVVSPADWKRK